MRNKIIIGFFVLVGVFVVLQLTKSDTTQTPQDLSKNNNVQLVNSVEFSSLIKKGDGFLVDVHTPEQTHIPGTDAFIPFDKITENLNQLPKDKGTPILVYCRSGSMSEIASNEISKLGYVNVYDLEGGINAYKHVFQNVVVAPSNQDLGTVIYGDVPTTNFTLTNFTPLPLKVTRVSTSCGCTSAEVKERELKAYDSTTVKVSFDPAVHGDDTDLGELTRSIYIETDNLNFPRLESTITANVIR